MISSDRVRVGVIGGGWISDVHLRALALVPEARLEAIADYRRPRERPGRASKLAEKYRIPRYHEDYRALLASAEVDAVIVGLPNALHAEVVLAAIDAGKDVLIEKPMCLTMRDADEIVRRAAEKQRIVGYAEELCYCPKLERMKDLIDRGAIGKPFLVKQTEAHAGPYSDWFFEPALAGGGALLDMGCHSIEFARWLLGKVPVRRVSATLSTFVHKERPGPLEDHVIVELEFEGGARASVEAGWCLHGGMESVARAIGPAGVIDVDLLRGNGFRMFSLAGVSTEEIAPGWSVPDFDWLVSNGYPAEISDFVRCVQTRGTPRESAKDGRDVLEICCAAYASAARGCVIELPFHPDEASSFPAEPWLRSRART